MKAIGGWLAVLLLVIGAASAGLWQFYDLVKSQEYDLALSSIKQDFLQSTVGLGLLDTNNYKQEVGIALTRYFNELDKLRKIYPGYSDVERERRRNVSEFQRGRMTETQKYAREERISITLDLFERMHSSQYRPLFTAQDNTFRFDMYDISRSKVSGEDRIKIAYIHWGAFGPIAYQSIVGKMRTQPEDRKAIAIPQIVGEGQPPNLQIDPEHWVREFPPGMEIGYYDFPLFPREANSVELHFDFSIRTIGGTSIDIHHEFPPIAIPEEWKVGVDQKWKAREHLANEADLRDIHSNKVITESQVDL